MVFRCCNSLKGKLQHSISQAFFLKWETENKDLRLDYSTYVESKE